MGISERYLKRIFKSGEFHAGYFVLSLAGVSPYPLKLGYIILSEYLSALLPNVLSFCGVHFTPILPRCQAYNT